MGGLRTPALLATSVAAAAAVLATGAAPAAGAVPKRSCAYPGSRTVLSTPSARVYYTRARRPFSCYRITGRRVALDVGVDRFYTPGDARLGLLRTAGRMLAYTWLDPGIPAVFVHVVDMRTARFKHRLRIEPAVVIEPSAVAVTALVTNRNGSVAWIQRLEGEVSVWRADRRGRRRLATSARIGLRSLRVQGRRIAWRVGSARRSASLL